jgi:hypothetical protein
MSLPNLLDLDDDVVDSVAMVVRGWCDTHQVPLDSQRGRDAMEEAIRLAIEGERSDIILADKLSLHMRVEQ